MFIAGLKKFSLADYPGEQACVVFLPGCNYRCPWCCYGQYVEGSQKTGLFEESFWSFLDEEKDRLTACVVTGGEPTIYKELPAFLKTIKKRGYKVKLETNGSNPAILEELIKERLVDFISLDIKAPREKYGYLIGFPQDAMNYLLSKIDRSISLLKEGAVDYEFKTTVGSYLSKNDVLSIAHWIRPAKRYVLVNFRPQQTLNQEFSLYKPIEQQKLSHLKNSLASFFDSCEIQ